MPINLASIKQELFPGLRGIEGRYQQIPTQWDRVFERGSSNMALERTSEMRFLGLLQQKSEGGAVAFDNAAGDRYIYNQEHLEWALGYAITRKAIEDNLYKDQFDPSNLGLMDSAAQTKEIVGANILNNATTYDSTIVGDGKALCATDHPIDGTTWANRPTVDVDLSESALENAQIAIRYFPDQAGLRIMARGRLLVIPPQLKYVATRLLMTELRPGTANNDVNAIKWGNDYAEGFQVMDFLTSQFSWFVKTDKKGLLYLERRRFDTDMQVDFTTQNLLVLCTERYSFGYYNPRAVYGSFPTA
jgi:hypothetical protein